MQRTEKFIKMYEAHGARNYVPLPIVLTRGLGAKVWDVEGNEYLDFLSSYSALNFGHRNPELITALKEQAEKLTLCSRAFYSEELALLSEELTSFAGFEAMLPMNSGAEACETALKMARKWGYEKKKIPPDQARIIAMENNFHGRTVSLISFSTEEKYREGFGPLTPGFDCVRFGDAKAVEKAISKNTAAVFLEPVQAEAGILIPPKGYLSSLRQICDDKKILLILDEIQTGLGRTGRNFCYEHDGIRPDVLTLGKSLGGGLLPISAVLADWDVMDVMGPGTHGSTFGGNPLACAVARTALKLMKKLNLSSRAESLGKIALERLKSSKLPKVKGIRGQGLLIGIELEPSAGGARSYCEAIAQKGVLCKETHEHVIRIAPPLVIEEKDLLAGLNVIVEAIRSK